MQGLQAVLILRSKGNQQRKLKEIIRGRNLKIPQGESLRDLGYIFGPFPNGLLLKDAMKIIRRIFPYIDGDSSKRNNIEFYKQLGLVPIIEETSQKASFSRVLGRGRTRGQTSSKKNFSALSHQYKNNIKNLKLFFEGKKKSVISNFKKEMMQYAKNKEFEKAGEIKKRIFALEHINDVALIKDDITQENTFGKILGSHRQGLLEARPDHSQKYFLAPLSRIEAYDIAHLVGSNMVGVMTVIENGELAKHEYKKFIIRTQSKSNDTGALEEVLSRRFRHIEWGLPSLVVMDGSTAQINIAKSVLSRYQFKIPIVSVVKDDKHKAKAIMGDESLIKKYKKEIILANNESHRFAITFHKKRRDKNFLL
jgi:excinuclease UvrABC nuclease subunit